MPTKERAQSLYAKQQSFIQIFTEELLSEFDHARDVFAGRADPKKDFTKIVLDALGMIPLPDATPGTVSAVFTGGLFVAGKLHDRATSAARDRMLSSYDSLLIRSRLEQLAEETARIAARRYAYQIDKIKESSLRAFAQAGVDRVYYYLSRQLKDLRPAERMTVGHFLNGLQAATAAYGIARLDLAPRKVMLQTEDSERFQRWTSEGAYMRSGLMTANTSEGSLSFQYYIVNENRAKVNLNGDGLGNSYPKYGFRLVDSVEVTAEYVSYLPVGPHAEVLTNAPVLQVEISAVNIDAYMTARRTLEYGKSLNHFVAEKIANNHNTHLWPECITTVFSGRCTAHLAGGDFSGVDFSGADLSELDLERSLWHRSYLQRAKLTHAQMPAADFTKARLQLANLSGSNGHRAILNQANLSFANVEHANLTDTQVLCLVAEECDFRKASVGLELTGLQGKYEEIHAELMVLSEREGLLEINNGKLTSRYESLVMAVDRDSGELRKAKDELAVIRYELVEIRRKFNELRDRAADLSAASIPNKAEIQEALRKYYQLNFAYIERLFQAQIKSKVKIRDGFVNLNIVEEKDVREKESHLRNAVTERLVSTDVTSASGAGRVDETIRIMADKEKYLQAFEEIYEVKTHLPYEDLLKKTAMDDGEHQVIVLGKPGVGKTTLIRKLCYEWASFPEEIGSGVESGASAGAGSVVFDETCGKGLFGQLQSQFDYVINLPLRELQRENVSLRVFIKKKYFKQTSCNADAIFEFLCDNNDRVLWIIDGYDEITSGNSFALKPELYDLLSRSKHYLITSRPCYENEIEFDKKLEVVGFQQPQIEEFINKYFEGESGLASKDAATELSSEALISFIKINKGLCGIAHIPIMLELICKAWKTNQLRTRSSGTLIDLYMSIMQGLKDHLLVGRSDAERGLIEGRLSQLAYLSFIQGKLVFNPDEIYYVSSMVCPTQEEMAKINEFGVLKLISGGDDSRLQFCDYYFVHLTVQEYLAALHMANVLSAGEDSPYYIDVVKIINKNKYDPRFELLLGYIAGILAQNQNLTPLNNFFILIVNESRDLIGVRESSLVLRIVNETIWNAKFFLGRVWLERFCKAIEKIAGVELYRALLRSAIDYFHLPGIIDIPANTLLSGNPGICVMASSFIECYGFNKPVRIEHLLRMLSSRDYQTKKSAIISLGNIKANTPIVVNALLSTLGRAETAWLSTEVIESLDKLQVLTKEVLETMLLCKLDLIDEPRHHSRGDQHEKPGGILVEKFKKFKRRDQKLVEEVLINATKHKDDNIRIRAAVILGYMGIKSQAVIDALMELLSDRPALIVFYYMKSLMLLCPKEPRIQEHLMRLVRNEKSSVKLVAAEMLAEIGAVTEEVVHDIIDHRINTYAHEDHLFWFLTLALLKNLPLMAPLLISAADRYADALMKRRFYIDDVRDELIDLLSYDNESVRLSARRILGFSKFDIVGIEDKLIALLGRDDEHIKQSVLRILLDNGATKSPEFKHCLVRGLRTIGEYNSFYVDLALRLKEFILEVVGCIIDWAENPINISSAVKYLFELRRSFDERGLRSDEKIDLTGEIGRLILIALDSDEKSVRENIMLVTLGYSASEAVVVAIINKLNEGGYRRKSEAILYLIRNNKHTPEIFNQFFEIYRSGGYFMLSESIELLAKHATPEVVDYLLKWISNSFDRRHKIIESLGCVPVKKEEVASALVRIIHSDDCSAYLKEVVVSLGNLGVVNDSVISVLRLALNTSKICTMKAVTRSLDQLALIDAEVIAYMLLDFEKINYFFRQDFGAIIKINFKNGFGKIIKKLINLSPTFSLWTGSTFTPFFVPMLIEERAVVYFIGNIFHVHIFGRLLSIPLSDYEKRILLDNLRAALVRLGGSTFSILDKPVEFSSPRVSMLVRGDGSRGEANNLSKDFSNKIWIGLMTGSGGVTAKELFVKLKLGTAVTFKINLPFVGIEEIILPEGAFSQLQRNERRFLPLLHDVAYACGFEYWSEDKIELIQAKFLVLILQQLNSIGRTDVSAVFKREARLLLGWSPILDQDLIRSVRAGVTVEEMRLLLAQGADVEACQVHALTPTLTKGVRSLQIAAKYGYAHLVSGLLAVGAEVDARDYYGCTALMIAIYRQAQSPTPRFLKIVEHLLGAGANVNLASLRWFDNGLKKATSLLTFGGQPGRGNHKGWTSLHLAAYYSDSKELINLLCAHHANLDLKTAADCEPALANKTPLELAMIAGHSNAEDAIRARATITSFSEAVAATEASLGVAV